jgi:CubicO group peptidase (beta-lactamase class C family)
MKIHKTSLLALQKDIKKLLEKGVLEGVFPSAAAGISIGLGKEKKIIISHCGNATFYPEKRKLKKQDFFDLASLTKPLATTVAILCLIKEKKIDADEKLSSLLEKKIAGDKNQITTKHLLSHSSGLPAHREYFNTLKNIPPKEKNIFVENFLLQEQLEYAPGSAYLYSDLGFMMLGRIIEKKAGCTLSHYVKEKILRPLNLEKKIFYMPLFKEKKNHKKIDFVATENCPWRKKILTGEVHDDNCYTMGGVAGHSGLFGNIEGVTIYTSLILDMWKGYLKHTNINKEDLVCFLARQNKIPGSSWALGFDTPAKTESSSGSYLSQNSVGHLGFTGTSFWIDPENEVVIVLLSNRVHPSRENIKIKKFRPYFHDRVMEKLFPQNK